MISSKVRTAAIAALSIVAAGTPWDVLGSGEFRR